MRALSRAELDAPDASSVTPGSSLLQRTGGWIGRQWSGFIESTIVKYALIVALTVAAVVATPLLSPFLAGALWIGGIALLLGPTIANTAASTYWNVTVEGQGFWQGLWGGITSDSLIGTTFSTVTNYDLTTGNYLGLTWQQPAMTAVDSLAAMAAARVGMRFGQMATGQRCGFFTKCFVAGTPILVEGGSKAIEDLRDFRTHGDGCDRVLSRSEYDPEGALELRRVLRRFVRVSPVLNVRVAGRVIGTTGEHPFWIDGRGWRQAVELRAGDLLRMPDGNRVAVEGVEEAGRVETVYNVEVEGFHTYYVGSGEWGFSVWAHNADPCTPGGLGEGAKPPKEIFIDASKSPKAAQHLIDSGAVDRPLAANRPGSQGNRRDALRGKPKVPGHDLDESPPAILRKPGDPVSVRPVDSSDNRSAGAQLGNQMRDVADGDQVIIRIINKPNL